jgi:hypothetical protein
MQMSCVEDTIEVLPKNSRERTEQLVVSYMQILLEKL